VNKIIGPFPPNGASKAAAFWGSSARSCCAALRDTPSLPTLPYFPWNHGCRQERQLALLCLKGMEARPASSNDLRALMRGGRRYCFADVLVAARSLRTQFTKGRALPTCFTLRVSCLPHTLHFFLHQNCPYPKPPPELPVLRIPLAGKSPTSPLVASAETRPRCAHSLGRLTPRPSQLRIFIRLWPRYVRYLHLVGASSVATLSC
jgi:hypothetical protein